MCGHAKCGLVHTLLKLASCLHLFFLFNVSYMQSHRIADPPPVKIPRCVKRNVPCPPNGNIYLNSAALGDGAAADDRLGFLSCDWDKSMRQSMFEVAVALGVDHHQFADCLSSCGQLETFMALLGQLSFQWREISRVHNISSPLCPGGFASKSVCL